MADMTRAFVTGCPVRHSRSPRIHRYWLALYKLEGRYEAVETTVEAFPDFIRSLALQQFKGGNVTLPHKETAFRLAEKHDDVAAGIGAVNTLWLEKGVLHGTNTDAYGFARNLDDLAPGWEQESALVIGAGGASRAVLFALKQRGFKQVVIINRTRRRAEALADHFGQGFVADDWRQINHHIGAAALIVNTTSLGLETHEDGKSAGTVEAFDFTRARPGAVVTDLVYTPLMTPFLQKAQTSGLKIVDGIGMLLHQAVPGFERWFGLRPEVTPELRAHVLEGIGEGQ